MMSRHLIYFSTSSSITVVLKLDGSVVSVQPQQKLLVNSVRYIGSVNNFGKCVERAFDQWLGSYMAPIHYQNDDL